MQKFSTEEFIKRANVVHGDTYDYGRVVYSGMYNKISIVCKQHGIFIQAPVNHVHREQGCPKCKSDKLRNAFVKTLEDFISDAVCVHGKEYDYSKVSYKGAAVKVEIVCKEHGSFWQVPTNHIDKGRGCSKCKGGVRDTRESFVEKAAVVHGSLYDYSNTIYVNSHSKVEVVCKQHGMFLQSPNVHLMGSGCPSCAGGSVSKASQNWLDFLGLSQKNREVLFPELGIRVDAFDPETNTVYEFLGDIWHGNPNVCDMTKANRVNKVFYAELFDKTIERLFLLRQSGYNLNIIWEEDFRKGV